MNRAQVFVVTFLCYTSIHALRTSYSSAKKDIAKDIDIDIKFMGIVDALMLTFLGIGHFLHAIYPIKKPVKSLWIAMLICGLNYGLIPVCMLISYLRNIYVLSVLMSFNGFLQSYTWPNLLMIVNSKFSPEKHSALLGFWSANANFGNIMGFGVFQILNKMNQSLPTEEKYAVSTIGLSACAIYAFINGIYIFFRFEELPIAGANQIRQKSIMIYKNTTQFKQKLNESEEFLFTQNNLQHHFVSDVKDNSSSKSKNTIKSADHLFDIRSMSNLSRKSINTLKSINSKIQRGAVKSIRIVNQPQKVAQTPLSVLQVFKDPNILFLTITFSLAKSVIYGIMLWLPLYFKSRSDLESYAGTIPITYDVAAIFGSVGIGYLFKKIINKGFLMIPFMIALFICFFLLRFIQGVLIFYFIVIAVVGFCLGGIFNTLSGLVVMQLTKVIPQNLKTSSLGFYSALTMAVGNITTALTQVLIGFVIGKENQQSIFLVFMIYAAICLFCLVSIAVLTIRQNNNLSKGQVVVIQQIKQEDNDSQGYEAPNPDFLNGQKIASVHKSQNQVKAPQ